MEETGVERRREKLASDLHEESIYPGRTDPVTVVTYTYMVAPV